MNGFEAPKIYFVFFLTCAIVGSIGGCMKEKNNGQGTDGATNSDTAKTAPQSDLDGQAILRDLVNKYASATTYQDRAVLYLDYRMHGNNIQEPQPWSTSWDRNGRLAAQVFNSQFRCDGGLLSCYVFDIATANLDNQQLLIPYQSQLPIAQLYRDPIARHFVGGYSELPLDESDLVSMPKLIPPTISLLTNQVPCGWLQNPSQVERLPDETINDTPCYVVRCLSDGTTADIWVDQSSSMLVQMSLPLKLLAGEVITSPEITDVFLLAKFHDAQLDKAVTEEMFAIQLRPEASPVRKYVELPPAFPSELIGETAPQFQLQTPEGKIRTKLFFDGKVTAFLWLAGRSSFSAIKQFEAFTSEFPTDKFHFASVYSDSELKSPGAGATEIVDELSMAIDGSSMQVYYDEQLQASTALGVKAIPSVIVLDGDSKIQFARALSDENWPKDVKAALQRVYDGDDVAVEMQAEFQHFLASYHQQLVTVSAEELIKETTLEKPGTDRPKNRPSMRLHPQQSWASKEFKKAGNVAVLGSNKPEGNRLLVLDGWRTVVELNEAGVQLSRHELQLPEGEAANLIRVHSSNNRGNLYAVFSALGKQVFLFDDTWQSVGTYPSATTKHQGIRDCQLTDLDSNGVPELLVAFDDENGVHLVNPTTGQGSKISESVAMSLAPFGDDMVISGQGKIGLLKTGLQNVDETELQFRRIASVGTFQICGLGSTDTGNWNAVGFDSALERAWTLAVGSQFFETQIEPIAVTQCNGEAIWAIADTDDVIHLVSAAGKWLGDFQSQSQLGGVALTTSDGQTSLIISTSGGVECWNLNLQPSPIRPASSKK